MQKTYLFYDIETTGLNKCFDQILQFAAIRTDLALNILSQHEIKIRLNPDVIPAPGALLTHGISIQEMQTGEPEYEAIKKIHQLLNTPGTVSMGYNTLGFDDEFLRFSFYRNLLPPYTHQYHNHCSRMDLYPITVLYYLLHPTVLKWPEKDGKINLKLEHLSRINHLAEGPAHQAMTDVTACLELARKLIAIRDGWQQATRYFDRTIDRTPIDSMSAALAIQGHFGADLNYQVPVMPLGQHRHYKNQSLWLRLDAENLETAPVTQAIRKRPAEPPLLLPLAYHNLSADRLSLSKKNKNYLRAHPAHFKKICDYHQNYIYPKIPNLDIYGALYETGFVKPQEEYLFNQFHAATHIPAKEKIAATFPNPLHRQLAVRILGRYDLNSNQLSEKNQREFETYLQTIFTSTITTTDYKNQPRLTPDIALQQIAALAPQQAALLAHFKQYLQNLQ